MKTKKCIMCQNKDILFTKTFCSNECRFIDRNRYTGEGYYEYLERKKENTRYPYSKKLTKKA